MLTEGCIYKITNNNTGKFYIGSTTKEIEKRLNQHKHDLTSGYDVIKDGNFNVEKLEVVFFDKKEELFIVEANYIKKYLDNPLLTNKKIPYLSDEQRKERTRIKNKKSYDKLKTTICECGGQYKRHRNRHLNTKIHMEYIMQIKS